MHNYSLSHCSKKPQIQDLRDQIKIRKRKKDKFLNSAHFFLRVCKKTCCNTNTVNFLGFQ